MNATVYRTKQADQQLAALPATERAAAERRIAKINTVEGLLAHSKPIGRQPLGEVRRFRASRTVRILAAVDHDTVTILGVGLRQG